MVHSLADYKILFSHSRDSVTCTSRRRKSPYRMLKKIVQQGRRRVETGGVPSQGYVEDFDEPRTPLADFFSILLEGLTLADGLNARLRQAAAGVHHMPSHPLELHTYGSSLDDCRSSREDWFVNVRPGRLQRSPARYRMACEPDRYEWLGRDQSSWRARWPDLPLRPVAGGAPVEERGGCLPCHAGALPRLVAAPHHL